MFRHGDAIRRELLHQRCPSEPSNISLRATTHDMNKLRNCRNIGRLACTTFLISNFRRVLSVVCFLLGNSPASEFYMPTFRNTLFHLHRQVGVCRILHIPTCLWRWNRQCGPKRRHIKFRRRGITQEKAYNIVQLCWNNSLRMAPQCRKMLELWWLTHNAVGECRICCTSAFSVAQWGPKPTDCLQPILCSCDRSS